MNRRELLQGAASIPLVAVLPAIEAIPSAKAAVRPMRWFAVGDDEFVHPFLGRTQAEAIREYAYSHGATVGEECPECGEYECSEHNEDLDEPLPWIECHEPSAWSEIPHNRDLTGADWVRAGYRTPCDRCDDDEPTECYVHGSEALCCDCIEVAKLLDMDRLIGTDKSCCACEYYALRLGEPVPSPAARESTPAHLVR
jgi:hypothetical protein